MKTIRIGNAAGFAGDNLDAPRLLTEAGGLDYLTLEYLAELTMSILAHQMSKRPDAGYVADFPLVMESLCDSLTNQPGLRIVTNAGGMNPTACARHVSQILAEHQLNDLPVAAVTGDDLFSELDAHLAGGESFSNLETGAALDEIRERVVCANAYLGCGGIVEALAAGARIVITGRVADASLAVGPCVHEFGWPMNDWDRLAAATVAGHLIECGAQVSGGMYSDGSPDISLADVGYPIAEIDEKASFVITKAEGTGGTVCTGTVAEQLVYEIGDPAHYLTPDVDADFRHVVLTEEATDRVRVEGARGNPAPEKYKVSLAYHDGFTASGTLVIAGPQAERNARKSAEMIFERVRRAGFDLSRTHVECLGCGDTLPGIWPRPENPFEVVLRVGVHDPSREAVERWAREFAPLVTSGPPGVSGYTGARVKARRVLAYWPTTISRGLVSSEITVRSAKDWLL